MRLSVLRLLGLDRREGVDAAELLRKAGVFDLPSEAAERQACALAKRGERDRKSRDLYQKLIKLAAEARKGGWTPDMPFPESLIVSHGIAEHLTLE